MSQHQAPAHKVKTQLGQDVRRGHGVCDFASLKEFIKASYGAALPKAYVLQYLDEEQDTVTIASDADLEAAFRFAAGQGRTLKVLVVKTKPNPKQKQAAEDKDDSPAEEDVPPPGLWAMIREDAAFRREFVDLVAEFLTLVRADEAASLQQAFDKVAAAHPRVAEHPDVVRARAFLLPMAFVHVQPFAVFLAAIDPARVGAVVDKVAEMIPDEGGMGPMGFMPRPHMFRMLRHLLGGHGPHGPPFGRRGWHGRRGPWAGCARRFAHGGCPRRQQQCPPWSQAKVEGDAATLADGAEVVPNQGFAKSWRVRNTGAEPWPQGTVVTYVGHPRNPLVSRASFPVTSAAAGEAATVTVGLAAPPAPGDFRVEFRLATPDGQLFGDVMSARVVVTGPASEPRLPCGCGGALFEAQARNVYAAGRVQCDGCSRKMGGKQKVFHCSGGGNDQHPNGYDLCMRCAKAAMPQPEVMPAPEPEPEPQAAPEPEPEPEAKEAPAEEPQAEAEPEAEPEQEPQAAQELPAWATATADREVLKQYYREYLAAVRAQQEAAQAEAAKPPQEPAPEPEPEAEPMPEPSAPAPASPASPASGSEASWVPVSPEPAAEPAAKPYKYAEQLAKVQALGFDMEEEVVKSLLEQHGGRVDLVVHDLLGV